MDKLNTNEPDRVTKLTISQLLNDTGGTDDNTTGTNACASASAASEPASYGRGAFATRNDHPHSLQHEMHDEGFMGPSAHPQVARQKKVKRAAMSKEQQERAIVHLEAKLALLQPPLPPAKPCGTQHAAFENPHDSAGHEADVKWQGSNEQPHRWDAENVMRANILHNTSDIEETLFRVGHDESHRSPLLLNAPNVMFESGVHHDAQRSLGRFPGPIFEEDETLTGAAANIVPPFSSIGRDLGYHPTPHSNPIASGKKRKSADEVEVRGRLKANIPFGKTKKARKDEIAKKLSKAQDIIDQLSQFGEPFEQSLDKFMEEVGHALLKGGDDGSAIEQLRVMGIEWKQSNRSQLVKIASFLERNAVLPVGGLELPNSGLEDAERADNIIVIE